MESKINELLKKLNDQQIVKEEYYYKMGNLIECILFLSTDALDSVPDILTKENEKEQVEQSINVQGRICQIITLTEILKDRVKKENWDDLFDLIYKYENLKKMNHYGKLK
ncbi:hypothetical protein [Parabacteroides sp. Marseille-P3160]|uniref:hypothetical protein n=1 Tax=Parabacteroides sp. Marseille-P3160 TaxID=1917887 RepID=UPI0009B9CF3C|nr:hypothetical protein [Parabacteroides sp. Marseille-P3160]